MVAHTGFITLARRVQPRGVDAARVVPLEPDDEASEPEPA
jgi:hypothetical protein